MSATSPRKSPTPRSSSQSDTSSSQSDTSTASSSSNLNGSSSAPEISAAVQELLELRAEKQKYKELQALLRQGQESLKRQLEESYQAETKFREALKNITDVSVDVDNVFNAMLDDLNRMSRYLQQPYVSQLPKPKRLDYLDNKYKAWLRRSIQHHANAIELLCETLEGLEKEPPQNGHTGQKNDLTVSDT